jgi:HTH-type transcriptional regulator/antitoxin HigA
MINKFIKTEEDYSLVLSRIEDLMDAEANTSEAEELELFATLVELYEDEHYAMDIPHTSSEGSALPFIMHWSSMR